MFSSKKLRSFVVPFVVSMAIAPLFPLSVRGREASPENKNSVLFNDSHFHLTNYIQQGLTTRELLKLMGEKVKRVALFGIPLQQKWDYFESGERAPDYYLLSDSRLYYYSFVDSIIAQQYLQLSEEERQRFDPMITGFNPTDMYATDHIVRVLRMYPGVFSGIGEFTIHKEFVTPKTEGDPASLRNPALDRIFALAGEIGLVVILHCDIDTVRSAGERTAHFDDLKKVFKRHKNTTIIWAHTGLGRFVRPTKNHLSLLREILSDEELKHVSFDISWDEVAKYVVEDEQMTRDWAKLITDYPDRFLFGTDSVAPKTEEAYLKTYRDYQPLWNLLDEKTSYQVRIGNYERIFDEANQKVRAWERKQVNQLERLKSQFKLEKLLKQDACFIDKCNKFKAVTPLGNFKHSLTSPHPSYTRIRSEFKTRR